MSDCSNHRRDVYGYTDMKYLAETISNLHYETLSELLDHLSKKLWLDAKKDNDGGRLNLAQLLEAASKNIHFARTQIEAAWILSKPFMNQNSKPDHHE